MSINWLWYELPTNSIQKWPTIMNKQKLQLTKSEKQTQKDDAPKSSTKNHGSNNKLVKQGTRAVN